MTGRKLEDLPAVARHRLMVRALTRPALSTTGLLLVYYLAPLDGRLTGTTVVAMIVALALVATLLIWQVQRIRTAKYPRLQAIEAVAVSLPLFVLAFAALYFVSSRNVPASFSEALSRTDALYFAVTVFSSVGFGDITPVAQGARVAVMIQMIGDLVLVGFVARVIMSAVQSGLRRHEPGNQPG